MSTSYFLLPTSYRRNTPLKKQNDKTSQKAILHAKSASPINAILLFIAYIVCTSLHNTTACLNVLVCTGVTSCALLADPRPIFTYLYHVIRIYQSHITVRMYKSSLYNPFLFAFLWCLIDIQVDVCSIYMSWVSHSICHMF